MNGIVEWLDSLPIWLYLIVTSLSAAFGLGIALFSFMFWHGDKIGMLSRVEMQQRGLARVFLGIVLWVMSIPFMVSVFFFCLHLISLFYMSVLGLSRENAMLAGLYTPIALLIPFWVRAWAQNKREK